MEMRDGFIIGVYNYCDRWCETCALTSYCRVWSTDCATVEACVGSTPAVLDSLRPPLWLEDVLEEMAALGGGALTTEEMAAGEPRMPAAHEELYERAKVYCRQAHDRVRPLERAAAHDPANSVAVVSWFASLIVSTIRRALAGLAEFDGDRTFPADHEGSAKVALLGIDRSNGAWRELVEAGRVSAAQAQPCFDELAWLRTRLEGAIPNARAFVRPGFDEPEAVAGLMAGECREKEKARTSFEIRAW